MFSLGTGPVRLCEGVTRREWLRVGGLGAVGLMLPDLLRGTAQAAEQAPLAGGHFGRAKSCIVCFLWGGPAHQDIWDLKPDAPSEVRGEFKPIRSSVPGTHLSEHIPRVAGLADRYALVRSVTHPDATHTVAMHYMLTGVRHRRPQSNPQHDPADFPCFGAAVQRLCKSPGVLPSSISLNAPATEIPSNFVFPGFFAGFLGNSYDPMFVPDDPSAPDFRPIRMSEAIGAERMRDRWSLLAELDQFRRKMNFEPAMRHAGEHHEKAFSLVNSPEAARAFEIDREDEATRDRYGRTAFGQGCLLARRLVEAGVRLVTVNWGHEYHPVFDDFWDTHNNNFSKLRNNLLPNFDNGFSALLEDLEQRGMLDDTLVVVLSEFGRTPKVSSNAGREHWPGCNSVVFAGAGIRGGALYGVSDKIAAFPTHDAVGPEDLAATIYHSLGIPLHTELVDHSGRPMPLNQGQPLLKLFG